jgi:hypothetical protein
VLKTTIEYYISRGSHVFACFVDFNKAFDRVNYWRLFNELLNDGVNTCIVKLLAFWYSNQAVAVRWLNVVTDTFGISNGTKQGSLLSPYFFARYIRGLLKSVHQTCIGCNIGGVFINILAYADDIVLLAPSWAALQRLIDVLHNEAFGLDMTVNGSKTLCMMFKPKDKAKVISHTFKNLCLGDKELKFTETFKYLGHMISSDLSDDTDLRREIRNMYVRANTVCRRFGRCSLRVKVKLYTAYCLCLYGAALWKNCLVSTKNSFKYCYNRCMKMFFNFKKYDSVTGMLLTLGLPSVTTILHNLYVSFAQSWKSCNNLLVLHLASLRLGL